MVPDAGLEIVDVHVGGLHQVVEPLQPPPHVGQLRLHRLQLHPLLLGNAVHLLVHQLDQLPDVALGEDVGANLLHHHLLEAAGVQPGGVAGPAAPLHQRLADVVGELAALGVLAGQRPPTLVALDQPAEQVGAADPAGMGLPGGAGAHLPVDLAEPGLGHDGGESLLHPHRLRLVLGVGAPVFDVNYLCRSRRLFLPVHLLLLTPLLSDTCPVAGDVEFQDDRVMHEAVYGRGSSHGVGEYVLPLGEDQVRGDT